MRLRINYGTCAKSGQCYYMHPGLVKKGARDLPELVSEEIAEDQREDVEILIDICPTLSIELVEDEEA